MKIRQALREQAPSLALQRSASDEIAKCDAERGELIAALKRARDTIANLPKSLGYDFTHLPGIDAVLAATLRRESTLT